MQLSQLVDGLNLPRVPRQYLDCEIKSISADSRTVTAESLFVALKGLQSDGSAYIEEAIQKGARVIVRQQLKENLKKISSNDICLIHVDDPRFCLQEMVKRFYAVPSSAVKTIGVTGTNGKTTVTYIIESILNASGHSCGVVGTVNYRVNKKIVPSKNTTPGLVENQQFLSELREKKIPYCVMEVSSHALTQGRVKLIDFHAAIFTNLTSDHLDYHKTTENYFKAKSILFTDLPPQAQAIINVDDVYGRRLVALTKSPVLTYAIKSKAELMARKISLSSRGSTFELVFNGQKVPCASPLIGLHNVYNILSAVGWALSENISWKKILLGVTNLTHVPGRLESVCAGQNFSVYIDYAHTADGLENVLKSIKKFCRGKIITVFGCGGDRDATKRPQMGKIASRYSDFVVVTSDNPRKEEPLLIIDDILKGITGKNFVVIVERADAIRHALKMARKDDVVLVAGKGHETYQIFKDKTIPFLEREIIEKYLRSR